MNSPVTPSNRQVLAQAHAVSLGWSCNAGETCQSTYQAKSVSSLNAMVLLDHFPSPFWARFSAFVSKLGLFLSRGHWLDGMGLGRRWAVFLRKPNPDQHKTCWHNHHHFQPNVRPPFLVSFRVVTPQSCAGFLPRAFT
jgi:hypothetical protein